VFYQPKTQIKIKKGKHMSELTKKEQEALEQEQRDFEAEQQKEAKTTPKKRIKTVKTAEQIKKDYIGGSNSENEKIEDKETKPMTEADFIAKMKQNTANTIELGATVLEIEEYRGEKKNKETNEVLTDDDGNILYHPISYTVHLSIDGGVLKLPITEKRASELIIGRRYFCEGKFMIVFQYGKEVIAPTISSYTLLY
jgi:hypothetical protein